MVAWLLSSRAPDRAAPARLQPRLRSLLVALVLVAAVPLSLLAGGLLWFGYERAVTRTNANALGIARQLGIDVDRRFATLRHGLDALAASPDLDTGDLAEFRAHAARFLGANKVATNVTLVTREGMQVLNTARPAGAAPLPARPELVRLFAGGEVAVTALVEGRVLGPVMVLGVPARRDDRVLFVVGAGVTPELLAGLFDDARLPPAWTVSVLDPVGRIVARRPHRPELVGQPATADLVAALAAGSEGTLRARTRDGVPVLAAFSRAPGSRYAVAIGVPEEELLGPVRSVAYLAGAIIVVVLAATLTLAARITRRIDGGMRALSTAAHAVGRRTMPPGKLGFREAEELRVGFNISAAELQQTDAELRELREEVRDGSLEGVQRLLDAAWGPLVLADANLHLVLMNEAAEAVFGGESPGAPARSLRDLFQPDGDGARVSPTPGRARLRDGTLVPCAMRTELLVLNGARYLAAGFRLGTD